METTLVKIRSKLYPLMLATSLVPSLALADQEIFSGIPMLGTEQVPAVNSTGYGAVTAIYDEASNILFYGFDWQLDGNNQAVAAHFHLGARGTTGPVVIDLGPVSGNSGKTTGAMGLTDAEELDLLAGNWYINVHSDAFPDGEIRAQMIEKSPMEGAQVYSPDQARLRLKDVMVPNFGIYDTELDVIPARTPLSFELDLAGTEKK